MSSFHTPALATECVRIIDPQAGGIYVDATLGGGGHAAAMFERCPELRMFGFDQDPQAIAEARETLAGYADRVEYIPCNFSRLRTELALRMIKSIDGILFDLGVSSHQLDTTERGFSFDRDAPLDMRMDTRSAMTAAQVVNELPAGELTQIFKNYGEEPRAARIAREIVAQRAQRPIQTTGELARILESVAGTGTKESLKTKLRVFQALRIYVNRELEVLRPALQDAINILKPGGRIVVLSYHSLEDRVVKNTFRDAATGCVCPPRAPQCVCGGKKRLVLLNKRPQSADEAELARNNRSRGARLRAAERIREES